MRPKDDRLPWRGLARARHQGRDRGADEAEHDHADRLVLPRRGGAAARLEADEQGIADDVAGEDDRADEGQPPGEDPVRQAAPAGDGAGAEPGHPDHLHARARRVDDHQAAVDEHRAAFARGVEAGEAEQPPARLGGDDAQRIAGIELQRRDHRQGQRRQAGERQHRRAGGRERRQGRGEGQRREHGRQQGGATRPSTVASEVSSTATASHPGAGSARRRGARRAMATREHRQRGQAERIVRAVAEARRRPAPVRPEGEREGGEAEQRPEAPAPLASGASAAAFVAGKASGLRRGGGAGCQIRTEARPTRAKRDSIAFPFQQPRRRTAAIATATIASVIARASQPSASGVLGTSAPIARLLTPAGIAEGCFTVVDRVGLGLRTT